MTKPKLIETLRALNDGASKYQARKIAGVSKQRIYQIWNAYNKTEEIPTIGKKIGRPKRPITDEERAIVKEAYELYRLSADALERLIYRDKKRHIPHNHIHRILLALGYAEIGKPGVKRKINWIRYERKHSLTAVHIDWHQRPNDGIWSFAVEDDASRKMLELLECDSPTTEKSIEGMERALKHGKILQCIMDHGSQFVSNIGGESLFQAFLAKQGIKPIFCRIKHPQSNGKVEKWFGTYEQHRDAFNNKEEFLEWYNGIRPHRSLNWADLETPNQAFERKKKAEV